MEQLTFALAIAGYAGLTAAAALPIRRRPRWLWPLTALVIVAHVLFVWAFRYEWRFSVATRNGYAGFVIFHVALAVVLASLVVSGAAARRLITVAFFVVTAGALGAVFRYDEVAIYQAPVMMLALVGVVSIAATWRSSSVPARE